MRSTREKTGRSKRSTSSRKAPSEPAEEIALGVQHLEVGGVSRVVAQPGETPRPAERLDPPRQRGALLGEGAPCHQRVLDLGEGRLHRLGIGRQRLALPRLARRHLAAELATVKDRLQQAERRLPDGRARAQQVAELAALRAVESR
jgi:hypothetical protein